MKKAVALLLFGSLMPMFFTGCKHGHDFMVSGIVTDGNNVPLTNVTIIGNWNEKYTDSLGRFEVTTYGLPRKKTSKATLGFKKDGYKQKDATVREGKNNVIRLKTCANCGKTSPGKSPH